MGECTDGFVEYNSTMVEDFLELGGGCAALLRGQKGFATHIYRIQAARRTQFIWRCRLKSIDDLGRVVAAQRELGVNRR